MRRVILTIGTVIFALMILAWFISPSPEVLTAVLVVGFVCELVLVLITVWAIYSDRITD